MQITHDLANSTSRYISWKYPHPCTRDMYKNDHCSLAYMSQELETD